MKFDLSGYIFEKYSSIIFHENPSSGGRIYQCGKTERHRQTDRQTDRQTERQTDRETDRQTDLTKQIVAFRNFANAPKCCSHECGPTFVSVAVKPNKTRI